MTTKTFWSYQDNFDFNSREKLKSEFYVSLETHRGDYSRRAVLTQFGLDAQGDLLAGRTPKQDATVLFGGHVGSGKSTELLEFKKIFNKNYTVSYLEITEALDINNLRYSDLVIALGHEIVKQFEALSLQPSATMLNPVLDWFNTRIIKQERFKDLSAEIKTGAEIGSGIPLLGKLLFSFTSKLHSGASYREELRREVRDGFTQLVQHFNLLIAHANELLAKQSWGPLLFIIDGTDKLRREDSADFFNVDVEQLLQIRANTILCAPISVLLEEGRTAQRFTLRHRLPMIKLFEKTELSIEADMNEGARDALAQMVLKRLPLEFFENIEALHYLVRMSGGHPRDLIRLVYRCFLNTDSPLIDLKLAKKSVKHVGTDYLRDIKQADWAELVKIDQSLGEDFERTDDRYRLLYQLVLLEYNNFWWRTHPLVRNTPSYERAVKAASEPKPA